LDAGGYFQRTPWRPGCKLGKLVRPSPLERRKPRATLLSRLEDHVVPRTLQRPTLDHDVERLGTQSAATIHPRRSRSLGGSRREEGRIGSRALPLKDLTMPEFALIACRVTSETKARVRRLADRDGITESTLLRRLLDVVLRTAGLDDPPTIAVPDKVNRDARVNVRLEPEDWLLLRERAQARGMASATYLSYLARCHLRGAAPLPKAEYTLLKQSVEQLAALGRNLNQIARAMNQSDRPASLGRAEVAAMLKLSESLRDHFRGLLDANDRSWRMDHDTPAR
jgi:hypothetical protein